MPMLVLSIRNKLPSKLVHYMVGCEFPFQSQHIIGGRQFLLLLNSVMRDRHEVSLGTLRQLPKLQTDLRRKLSISVGLTLGLQNLLNDITSKA